MRLIILPQAFKNVLPAMGNELITLLKETSISGYIDEARLELIQKSMLYTSYFCIFGIYHDDLSHIGFLLIIREILLCDASHIFALNGFTHCDVCH